MKSSARWRVEAVSLALPTCDQLEVLQCVYLFSTSSFTLSPFTAFPRDLLVAERYRGEGSCIDLSASKPIYQLHYIISKQSMSSLS